MPNNVNPRKSRNNPNNTSFLIYILSESLPAIKFEISVASEPRNKAIPILSKPTSICSEIIGIKGSIITIDKPNIV